MCLDFFIWPILEARGLKQRKISSENKWPLPTHLDQKFYSKTAKFEKKTP